MSSLADALSGPTRMGGHFVDMFPKGQDITWNLLPYILIWVAFGIVLIVSHAIQLPLTLVPIKRLTKAIRYSYS